MNTNYKTIGYLHSVESMGLLDGPGTRTIFFLQGCPLSCQYCHNPDSQEINVGREVTPEDILKIAERYRPYHGQDGGVTFSGGEPLLQGEFLYRTFQLLKDKGFNIALDTSGFGDKRYYSKIFPLVDTLLLDFKAFNQDSFKTMVAGNFQHFLSFVESLSSYGFNGNIWARHVMIPGFTDDKDFMESFVDLMTPILHLIERIEILPYHTSGIDKYKEIGRSYPLEGVPAMDPDKAKKLEVYANKIFGEKLQQRAKENNQARRIEENQSFSKEIQITNLEAKRTSLSKIPLLKNLSHLAQEEEIEDIKFFNVKTDDFIFKTGDQANFMYFIVKGEVKIYYHTVDGKEQIFYIYRNKDFVGGLNLLGNNSYLYNAQALTEGKVIALPAGLFNKYILNDPSALQIILGKSFERIRWAEELIQRLSASNSSMKTAGILLKLKNELGVETEEGIRIESSMNREELGSYSGLTRETITRKLGEFKELGYIELVGNKTIIIKDLEALEDFVF